MYIQYRGKFPGFSSNEAREPTVKHQYAASEGFIESPAYPEFLSLSQLSKASLLNAAAAATLLLISWMLAIVSAEETTSINPARSPVARHPYGTTLHNTHAKIKTLNELMIHQLDLTTITPLTVIRYRTDVNNRWNEPQ